MTVQVNALFYTFSQNNSGGYFVTSDEHGIGEYVSVQGTSKADALHRFDLIGQMVDGFHEYCECCGERWSTWSPEAGEVPTMYGEPLSELESSCFRKKYFVHMLDGTFTSHEFKVKA